MISEEFRSRALALVQPERREHVEGTARTAEHLAKRWGADVCSAVTAALLHDCTKHIKGAEQLKLCERYGIIITQDDRESPGVLHAMSGAEFALREFGVAREVADAIRTHTTGAPEMTMLQRIIYLADLIEPTRSFRGIDEIRSLADTDMLEAMIAATAHTVIYLCEGRRAVHTATVSTYNALLRERARRADK